MRRRTILAAGAAALLAALAAGCGGGDDGGTLTVYSGREEELVAPLFQQFEEATGIDVEVRYGDSAELAATLAEEGGGSPADVFFAQDAGSLGAVASEGLLAELSPDVLERVPERFRDPEGRWVGTSGRVRVAAYNTETVAESELPASVWDLLDPAWKGRIGFPPTNASFQAFVSALRILEGDDRAREWLDGIKANEPKLYEKNSQVVEAVAAGEIDLGLVNHYYLFELLDEQPDAPAANHFFGGGDPGGLVNTAGVGIVASTDDEEDAERFVDFLLSDEGQEYYATAEEAEYPLVAGIEPHEGLPPLDSLGAPDIALGDLGAELEATLELISAVGFTS